MSRLMGKLGHDSKFARKLGKQMYGPAPKIPKYPDFQPGRVVVFCNCCRPPRPYNHFQPRS